MSKPLCEAVFDWKDTPDLLDHLSSRYALVLDDKGRSFGVFEGDEALLRLEPPLVQRPQEGVAVAAYLDQWRGSKLGLYLVLLMQAGGTAMGVWRGDELLAHKVIRKYVIRGNGKAQTTYLKTRGKSRYGSRLRLQNAEALLVETNEKLHSWVDEFGAFDQIYYSCPVRMWPELFVTKPAPPFERGGVKIPMDVRDPKLAELKRVRWFITHGRLSYAAGLKLDARWRANEDHD